MNETFWFTFQSASSPWLPPCLNKPTLDNKWKKCDDRWTSLPKVKGRTIVELTEMNVSNVEWTSEHLAEARGGGMQWKTESSEKDSEMKIKCLSPREIINTRYQWRPHISSSCYFSSLVISWLVSRLSSGCKLILIYQFPLVRQRLKLKAWEFRSENGLMKNFITFSFVVYRLRWNGKLALICTARSDS